MESVKNGIQFTILTNYLTKLKIYRPWGHKESDETATEQQQRYTERL